MVVLDLATKGASEEGIGIIRFLLFNYQKLGGTIGPPIPPFSDGPDRKKNDK